MAYSVAVRLALHTPPTIPHQTTKPNQSHASPPITRTHTRKHTLPYPNKKCANVGMTNFLVPGLHIHAHHGGDRAGGAPRLLPLCDITGETW